MPVLTNLPASLFASDTITWTRPGGDYPPATYTSKYDFSREQSGALVSITGTDNGDGNFLFTTAGLTLAGIWYWRRYIDEAGALTTVENGRVTVKGIPASGVDLRSTVKQTLDALDAMLLGKASKDQISHSINGRSLSRLSPLEITQWRNHYQRLYDQELMELADETGGPDGGRYFVGFR